MLPSQFLFHLALKRDQVESFDRYPFNLPAVRGLDRMERLELHPNVTFFVGENGSGKSTLLEALAVSLGFNAEGGSRNFGFSTRASHSTLHEYLRVAKGVKRWRDGWFLRAESFFNVATEIEQLDEGPGGPPVIGSYGGRSLHAQSHGESFLALLNERFGGRGLYLLDEPEAALSPQRQMDALQRLHALVRQDAQFVIATHSPILMAYPDAWVYRFDADGIRRVTPEETEHHRVMRDFMTDPRARLAALLGD
jgi:predicted ATPase